MTQFSYCAVAVFGDTLDHQSHAIRRIAFVEDLFEIYTVFVITRAAFDGALNTVFGHVGCFGFVNCQPQAHVHVGIAAALPCCNDDFAGYAGEDLAFFRVGSALFTFNGCPM